MEIFQVVGRSASSKSIKTSHLILQVLRTELDLAWYAHLTLKKYYSNDNDDDDDDSGGGDDDDDDDKG